jgi:hypothetical protein
MPRPAKGAAFSIAANGSARNPKNHNSTVINSLWRRICRLRAASKPKNQSGDISE